MKTSLGAFIAAVLIAGATPAAAQVEAEANIARAEGRWGGEVGVGYSLFSLGAFRVTPAAGAFFGGGGDDDRYNLDADRRCIDGSSGAVVDGDRCDGSAVKLFGRLEGIYTLPWTLEVGAGARLISGEVRPYGTVAVPFGPLIRLKSNVGPKYVATGVSVRF